MSWMDHCRRAVTVILVVLALLAVPAVASARFSAARSAQLVTGTATLATPSGITGTYRCTSNGKAETIAVTVTAFVDAGPSTSYAFGLLVGTGVKGSLSSTSRSVTFAGSQPNDGEITTWTLAIQGSLARWTSEIGTVSIVCPAAKTATGSF